MRQASLRALSRGAVSRYAHHSCEPSGRRRDGAAGAVGAGTRLGWVLRRGGKGHGEAGWSGCRPRLVLGVEDVDDAEEDPRELDDAEEEDGVVAPQRVEPDGGDGGHAKMVGHH